MSVARFACNSSRTRLEFGKANEQSVPPPRPISKLCRYCPEFLRAKGTHRARRFAFGSRFPCSRDANARNGDATPRRNERRLGLGNVMLIGNVCCRHAVTGHWQKGKNQRSINRKHGCNELFANAHAGRVNNSTINRTNFD